MSVFAIVIDNFAIETVKSFDPHTSHDRNIGTVSNPSCDILFKSCLYILL